MIQRETAPRSEALPDGGVRIHFAAPILLHAEPKGSVTLRSPRIAENWEIGDPISFIFDDRGYGTPYVDRPRLATWIRTLMVDHDPDFIGRDSDLALGMLIEDAVLGFFQKARTRSKGPSATSSAQESPLPKSNG